MGKRLLVVVLLIAAAAGAWALATRPHAWWSASAPAIGTPESHGFYQCAMHPQIVSDKPGSCPICGMKLDYVEGTTATPAADAAAPHERRIVTYRNPMRPDVTSPVPAKDEMGMDYIPVYEDEVTGDAG